MLRKGEMIADPRTHWHEHLARMNPRRAALHAMSYKPMGLADIGHTKRYEDDLQRLLYDLNRLSGLIRQW
jgi:enterochelin esterase-like enzyme